MVTAHSASLPCARPPLPAGSSSQHTPTPASARRGACSLRCAATPEGAGGPMVQRRAALVSVPGLLLALRVSQPGLALAEDDAPTEAVAAAPAPTPGKTKVVVLGGNGFVGSRVCKLLVAAGCEVTSISRSGSRPAWADGKEEWVSSVTWAKGDVLSDDLSSTLKGKDSVISCIGVIGGTYEAMETGNGAANVAAVQKSKAAGVPKFVYVSVASIVPNAAGGIANATNFKGYFDGKKEAEDALEANYPGSSVVVKPSFIYGGSEFGIAPPRVTASYGSGIESLLSSGPIRSLAGAMPGPIALTLAPPVSVDSVAAASVAGALGLLPGGVVDGTDLINAAAKVYSEAYST